MTRIIKPFSKTKGDIAEFLAAAYLFLRGYRVVGRNVKGYFAEIDLLCIKENSLVAVEVKFRKKMMDCESAVSLGQKQRQSRQLQAFLSQYPDCDHFRIDYVFVSYQRWFIKHIKSVQS